jgi:hypothetical protein
MKKVLRVLLKPFLLVLVCAGILYWMNYSFDHSPLFRALFCGPAAGNGAVIGEMEPGSGVTLAMRDELAGRVAMFVFSCVTMMQFVALFVAVIVIGRLRDNTDMSPDLKLKQLDNSDIFLDVPLYIGLFGTVSSFLVMTYSPTSSRLIAYSSTLIGIIFSLVLRLSLNYPLRQRLIMAKGEHKK